MAIYDTLEEINLGNIANDGTGDDLREAFRKTKASLEYLYGTGNAPLVGGNVGATGVAVYKQKVDTTLEFRKIDAIGALTIAVVNDVITVDFAPSSSVNFNNQNITDVNSLTAITLNGALVGSVDGNVVGLIRSGGTVESNPFVNVNLLNSQVNTFDYGFIVTTFTNPIAYLLNELGTDMGTITNPNSVNIDAGTI
jgi:hypothetical protein